MGRDFDGVDDDIKFADDSAFDGVTGFTVSCWVQQDFQPSTGFDRMFSKWTGLGGWLMQESGTGDKVNYQSRQIDQSVTDNSLGDVSGTIYSHMIQRWDNSVNEQGGTLDGETEQTIATTGNLNANTSDIDIGSRDDQSITFTKGLIAEAVMWDVRLGDIEKLAIFRGVNPIAIRHENQQLYCPIWGNDSPEPNYGQKSAITGVVDSPVKASKHPPVELLEVYM